MWGIIVFPAIIALLLAALIAAAAVLIFVRPLTWRHLRWFLLVPLALLGGALGLVVLLLGYVVVERGYDALFGEDDFDRYQAIYGRETDMADAQMLSAAYYEGWSREVWLRAQPAPAQLEEMRAIPGLARSALGKGDIASLGSQHTLQWWYGADPAQTVLRCPDPLIRRSGEMPGWREVLFVECPANADDRPFVYVLARGVRERRDRLNRSQPSY